MSRRRRSGRETVKRLKRRKKRQRVRETDREKRKEKIVRSRNELHRCRILLVLIQIFVFCTVSSAICFSFLVAEDARQDGHLLFLSFSSLSRSLPPYALSNESSIPESLFVSISLYLYLSPRWSRLPLPRLSSTHYRYRYQNHYQPPAAISFLSLFYGGLIKKNSSAIWRLIRGKSVYRERENCCTSLHLRY